MPTIIESFQDLSVSDPMDELCDTMETCKLPTSEDEYAELVESITRTEYSYKNYTDDLIRFRRYIRVLDFSENPEISMWIEEFFEMAPVTMTSLMELSVKIGWGIMEHIPC